MEAHKPKFKDFDLKPFVFDSNQLCNFVVKTEEDLRKILKIYSLEDVLSSSLANWTHEGLGVYSLYSNSDIKLSDYLEVTTL